MKKGTFLWLGRMGLPLSLALCHIYPLAAQNKVILPDSIPWMLSDSLMRGDILQIGYATGDRRTVAGSVDQISEKRMNKGMISNPLNSINGQVAGVSMLPGREAMLNSVRVRGTTSLTGGNDPLVIIDGVFADLSTLSMISSRHRKFHDPQRCFRNGSIWRTRCFGCHKSKYQTRTQRKFQFELRREFQCRVYL